jgi:microcompartment protein CcmL/EutN
MEDGRPVMSTALGLIEFKTVPVAVGATDDMLKASEVDLVVANPVCPGKFVTIVSGPVANVTVSVDKGVASGGIFVVGFHVIANISHLVPPALSGTSEADPIEALGVLETINAVSAVMAGDALVKASKVRLIEIRLARGLGGKGEIFFTGELSAVEAASRVAKEKLGQEGSLVSSVIIARPHKALIEAIC